MDTLPQLLEEMAAAGYAATEWASNMPKDPAVLAADLRDRGLRMLGGFVGMELRNPAKREQEVQRGVEIGTYFQSLGRKLSDCGRQRRCGKDSVGRSGQPRRMG